jgi:hypothetical protein
MKIHLVYNKSKVTKNHYYYLFHFKSVTSRIIINGGPKLGRNNIGRIKILRIEILNNQKYVFVASRRNIRGALVVN